MLTIAFRRAVRVRLGLMKHGVVVLLLVLIVMPLKAGPLDDWYTVGMLNGHFWNGLKGEGEWAQPSDSLGLTTYGNEGRRQTSGSPRSRNGCRTRTCGTLMSLPWMKTG